MKTISEAIKDYLNTIKLARSENTLLAYHTALDNLVITLKDNKIDVENDPVNIINEEIISWFAQDLKSYAATTEQLYITAAKGFFGIFGCRRIVKRQSIQSKASNTPKDAKTRKKTPSIPRSKHQRDPGEAGKQNNRAE